MEASVIDASEGRLLLPVGVRAFALEQGAGRGHGAHRRWVLSCEPSVDRLPDALTASHRCGVHEDLVRLALWADEVLQWLGPVGLRLEILRRARRTLAGSRSTHLKIRLVRCLLFVGEVAEAVGELEDLPSVQDPKLTGELWIAKMVLAIHQNDLPTARSHALEARAHFVAQGDAENEAKTLERLAAIASMSGEDHEAEVWLEQALVCADQGSETYAQVLNRQGAICWYRGELSRAVQLVRAGRAAFLRRGDLSRLANVDLQLGLICLELDLDAAQRHLQDAVDRESSLGLPHWAGWYRVVLQLARWLAGSPVDVPGDLLPLLRSMQGAHLLGRWELACLFVGLMSDDRALAAQLREELRPRLCDHPAGEVMPFIASLAASADDGTAEGKLAAMQMVDEGGDSIANQSVEARLVAVALRHRLALSRASPPPPIVIGDGWLQIADAPPVDLRTRSAPRRILAALVDRLGGSGLDPEVLFEIGWPGEKAQPIAAKNRVYTAVSFLRRSGLGEALAREGDGYRLRPDAVRCSDDPIPGSRR